ncbi:MAG: hypothetical protein D6772_04990 [Bacteroidetes bacterium]|nr:MAG: hypothetical protein D6772_04990 [Bacteroidota bacterium]
MSLFTLLLWGTLIFAQETLPCRIAIDEVDPFDSLRTIASESVALGYLIPSQYETIDGPKLIEEADAIMLYSETDSISGFFLNLSLPEYRIQPVEAGFNVKFLLADSTVIGFYTFSEQGDFDRSINMRYYHHTAAIPLDYYYRIAFQEVMMIRVEYKRKVRTLTLNAKQRRELQRIIQCVGERAGLYPVKP